LEDSDEVGPELNEVSWWSNWTEAVWLDNNAYLLFSKDYPEYFFNRGGFLKVTNRAADIVGAMEVEFKKRNLAPNIFVQSESLDSRLLRVFAKKGYRIADQMSVMELETGSFKANTKLVLETVSDGTLEQWATVYLKAFYGDTKIIDVVLKTLGRVSGNKDAALVLATLDGKAAGCLALFRSQGVLGVYCVGTVPDMRREHVASTMLDLASKIASKENRKLVLQTILSDSVEPLYLKLGFRRLYLKELFAGETAGKLKS
jgi:hypothetical protein